MFDWIIIGCLAVLGFGLGFALFKIYQINEEKKQIQEYIVIAEEDLERSEKAIKTIETTINRQLIPSLSNNVKTMKNHSNDLTKIKNQLDKKNDT